MPTRRDTLSLIPSSLLLAGAAGAIRAGTTDAIAAGDQPTATKEEVKMVEPLSQQTEDLIARHMVGEAMLAAQFVAAAERNGMTANSINAALKDIVANSAIEEIAITDSTGRVYLCNNDADIDFTFDRDPAKQPQASAFWPLIDGSKKIVIQDPRKRETDYKVFKYVGVAGIDKPRIVHIGVSAANLSK